MSCPSTRSVLTLKNLTDFPFVSCYTQVGKGWHKILVKLFSDISELDEIPEDFEIVQIKEKFGGLRVYVTVGTDEIYDLIAVAELEAENTCESCGTKNDTVRNAPHNGFWLKTYCSECAGESQ